MANLDSSYLFAIGKIRALETKLIGLSYFFHFLESERFKAFHHFLQEKGYPQFKGVNSIDSILKGEIQKTYSLIILLDKSKILNDVIFLKNDLHNLKLCLKQKYFFKQNDIKKIFISPAQISYTEMINIVENEKWKRLFYPLGQWITQLVKKRIESPLEIDLFFDKRYVLWVKSKFMFSSIISAYYQKYIDWINIRFFFRVKTKNAVERFFIKGGILKKDIFLKLANSSKNEILKEFSSYGYDVSFDLEQLERNLDDCLLSAVIPAKYITFGIEPLFGFLIAKDREIKNVRNLLYGKYNNLSEEEIKVRFRKTYV